MNNIRLLYIDLFCGAGGTSTGVEDAKTDGEKCAKVIACVNHDTNAIASHAANHASKTSYRFDNFYDSPLSNDQLLALPDIIQYPTIHSAKDLELIKWFREILVASLLKTNNK